MFGKLEGRNFSVRKEVLEIIKQHITTFPQYEPNEKMIERLEQALNKNQKIAGADASFYFHELREVKLMQRGLSYSEAHQKALKDYQVSPFSVYHSEVIKAYPDEFNNKWRKAWGLPKNANY